MTSGRKKPSQPQINKFIQDSLAYLQAPLGSRKIGAKIIQMAGQKICDKDKIPVLREQQPPGFLAEKEFPYWVKCTKIYFLFIQYFFLHLLQLTKSGYLNQEGVKRETTTSENHITITKHSLNRRLNTFQSKGNQLS